MTSLPISRIVLYKHGIGYFEREGTVDGDTNVMLTFKQQEVSDVLKSLTVLDLTGGHVSSVSYDSTKPLEQLLSEVALKIPAHDSLVSLIPQIKGARVSLHTGVSDPVEGNLIGVDSSERQTGDGVVKVVLVSVVTDNGAIQSFDLHGLASMQILDETLRRDLDFYLRTQLSATKKDDRTFTLFAQGTGERTLRASYTLEAPVWKATYRIILGDEEDPAMIQGWAVVDNTQDEDWEDVELSLISGLPVSFVHDLYTPRYIQRPKVEVQDSTGVLPPQMEEAFELLECQAAPKKPKSPDFSYAAADIKVGAPARMLKAISSTPVQVREQIIGELLEYQIDHPVTIRRNQSALVPIVLRDFKGDSVLLYNKINRQDNPMNCVLFKNSTGLTLEGGPVTVLQGTTYVGEAMLETLKPDEERLIPYAVELGVAVTDTIGSHQDEVHRFVIKNGNLTEYHRKIISTTYTLKNKLAKSYVLFLEHPSSGQQPTGGQNWKLIDTEPPVEETKSYWRFKLELGEKETKKFVVKQEATLSTRHSLLDKMPPRLEFWLQQNYFDEAAAKLLNQIRETKQEESRLAEQSHKLEEEQKAIANAQKRIRENLQSLGDRSSEKNLRERYVGNLNTQEDRLEEIERELKTIAESISKYRENLRDLIGKLEYDSPVEVSSH